MTDDQGQPMKSMRKKSGLKIKGDYKPLDKAATGKKKGRKKF